MSKWDLLFVVKMLLNLLYSPVKAVLLLGCSVDRHHNLKVS